MKKLKLSILMFIQFFVWGGWYVTAGNFMVAEGMQNMTHWAYSVSPIAAIVSPFFLGFIADRFFNAEKVLGVLHLLSGLALIGAPLFSHAPWVFIALLGLHMLFYMPTLGLSNTVAFKNIENQEKDFPIIRVFGTIGWIVAGIIISGLLKADTSPLPFYLAGSAGILLGLYSFFLPKTPPGADPKTALSVKDIVGLKALEKLKSKSFFTFCLASFLICIPLAAYYNFAPIFVSAMEISSPAFKMSFGQMSEVLFMLVLPLMFARFGIKYILLGGMIAWALRYLLFAVSASTGMIPLVLLGIILHGICYDMFFVAGQIYIDKQSSEDIRSQAQGFLVLITYGLGMFIGAQLSGYLFNSFLGNAQSLSMTAWQQFWLIFAGMTTVIIGYFMMSFKDTQKH